MAGKTITVGKVGWKKLQGILDSFIEAINKNAPVKGHGIAIDYTDTGSIISVEPKSDDQQQQQQTQAPPAKMFLENTKWTQVTLVDPATCQQSTAYFLALAAGSSTEFDVTDNGDGTWTLTSSS